MTEKSLFISSCNRRQLARRRQGRRALLSLPPRVATLAPALLIVVAGFAAYVAGRGGI
jgi:hypothetical protein